MKAAWIIGAGVLSFGMLVCIAAAAQGMMAGKAQWGWFLFIAVLLAFGAGQALSAGDLAED